MNSSRFRTFFGGLLLLAASLYVFWPSLVRVPADDQMLYLAELKGSTSLLSGLNFYDYSVSRHYMKGDELLYRPLFFTWLAVENTLFTYHYVYWNLANILLHFAVVFLLWKFLESVQNSWFAFLFALLFSLLTAQVELVMWSHISGYIWALIFVLSGFYCARQATLPEAQCRGLWLLGYTASFTLGVFFYEFSFIFAFFTAIYLAAMLFRSREISKPRLALALAAPHLLYIAFYIPHALNAARLTYRADFSEKDSVIHLLADRLGAMFSALGALFKAAAMPGSIEWAISPFHRFVTGYQFNPPLWHLLAALALLVPLFFLFSRESFRKNKGIAAVVLPALCAYAFMLCIGRKYLTSYYNYPFDLLLLIFVYCMLDFSDPLRKHARTAFAAILLSFCAINAYYTLKVNELCHAQNIASHRLMNEITHFVDEHHSEPGFSIKVDFASPTINPLVSLRIGYLDHLEGVEKVRLAEIMFKQHYDNEHPLYVLKWDPNACQLAASKN
jgi:hypothetical protein